MNNDQPADIVAAFNTMTITDPRDASWCIDMGATSDLASDTNILSSLKASPIGVFSIDFSIQPASKRVLRRCTSTATATATAFSLTVQVNVDTFPILQFEGLGFTLKAYRPSSTSYGSIQAPVSIESTDDTSTCADEEEKEQQQQQIKLITVRDLIFSPKVTFYSWRGSRFEFEAEIDPKSCKISQDESENNPKSHNKLPQLGEESKKL
ncbi:hypothetical protein LXL04_033228 [Taraxacum kok-saghyz]